MCPTHDVKGTGIIKHRIYSYVNSSLRTVDAFRAVDWVRIQRELEQGGILGVFENRFSLRPNAVPESFAYMDGTGHMIFSFRKVSTTFSSPTE